VVQQAESGGEVTTTHGDSEAGYRFGPSEVDAVLRARPEKRYAYFVKRVADWEEVWGLRNADGWVMSATDAGQQVAPFWPFRPFAERAAVGSWSNTWPERIALHAFLDRWLPGLAGDGRRVCVLPDEHGQGATVAPAMLKADIEEEREKIE